jgi:hypothetical protein
MSRFRSHLRRNAVAYVALLLALGTGSVYAADKISGKSLKKRSVPANRIKADALTGAEIDESSLGGVPDAATVGGLGASAQPQANALLALGGDGRFPASTLTAPAFLYRADIGAAAQTVYENASFRITATCENDGPVPVMRPKTDHAGYAQQASSLNTTQALYSEVADSSVNTATPLRFQSNPEETGTLVYIDGARVMTITYTINTNLAGSDCLMAGTVLSN